MVRKFSGNFFVQAVGGQYQQASLFELQPACFRLTHAAIDPSKGRMKGAPIPDAEIFMRSFMGCQIVAFRQAFFIFVEKRVQYFMIFLSYNNL